MAIEIPGTVNGSVESEYAAVSTIIQRNMVANAEGFLVPSFSATINYMRKDYLVDAAGNKVGIVSKQDSAMAQTMTAETALNYGMLTLDAAALLPYFGQTMAQGEIIGEVVANMTDVIIRQDLIKRKILTDTSTTTPAPAATA